MNIQVKQVFYWGITAMALIALAGPYPDIATGMTLLIIFGVLLTHWPDYAQYLNIPYAQKKGA